VLDEIDRTVNIKEMEDILMEEGIHKFTEPQKGLLAMIAEKRTALQPVGAK